jgi:hypothetical protein
LVVQHLLQLLSRTELLLWPDTAWQTILFSFIIRGAAVVLAPLFHISFLKVQLSCANLSEFVWQDGRELCYCIQVPHVKLRHMHRHLRSTSTSDE